MKMTNESFDAIKKAIDNKDVSVDIHSELPLEMRVAYAENQNAEKHLRSVRDELDKSAETVITPNPDEGKTIKNNYTKKLKLDESINDFNIKEHNH